MKLSTATVFMMGSVAQAAIEGSTKPAKVSSSSDKFLNIAFIIAGVALVYYIVFWYISQHMIKK